MTAKSTAARCKSRFAFVGALVLLASGCGGDGIPAAGPDAPDTSDMGPFVLAKINANPSVTGTAKLVEFRQKSVSTQPLGGKTSSAVVEFEGVVTFSGDVSWSWQLVEPIGIYPL